jgi:hypothetical protein
MTNIGRLQKIMCNNPQKWTVSSILNYDYGNILLFDDQRALINLIQFYFIEGPFLESFGHQLTKLITPPAVIISSNHNWYDFWTNNTTDSFEHSSRRMYLWSGNDELLAPYLERKKTSYIVKPIGEPEAIQIKDLSWSEDVFASYEGIAGFLARGFGYCIAYQNHIVSLCMSYAHSEYGVEIEVDTAPLYQGRGLAKIVSAHFIAESLRRGITPLWDSSNQASDNVAQSLGFKLLQAYESIWSFINS